MHVFKTGFALSNSVDKARAERMERLLGTLRGMGSVLVAFSGGVDSSLLLYAAAEALGRDRVLAVTAKNSLFPESETARAAGCAGEIGVRCMSLDPGVLEIPGFRDNTAERCYICKKALYTKLMEIAGDERLNQVIDGSNADDLDEFRPGRRALKELGIRSPLVEAGLNKEDIRILSKKAGLSGWDKPAFACLATRFPYGVKITDKGLAQVSAAESFLAELTGLARAFRVRHHGSIARIEVDPQEFSKLTDPEVSGKVVEKFKSLGYRYIALDLEGFRSGSMDSEI